MVWVGHFGKTGYLGTGVSLTPPHVLVWCLLSSILAWRRFLSPAFKYLCGGGRSLVGFTWFYCADHQKKAYHFPPPMPADRYSCPTGVEVVGHIPPWRHCLRTSHWVQRWETGPYRDRAAGTEGRGQFLRRRTSRLRFSSLSMCVIVKIDNLLKN